MKDSILTGYLAPEGFEKELRAEIGLHPDLTLQKELQRLLLVDGPLRDLAFAQNRWENMQIAHFDSISQAAQVLKKNGKLWSLYSTDFHRRASLIQEQLLKLKTGAQIFRGPKPDRKLGAWTLENEKTLWFSLATDSVYPLGEVQFQEDKSAPSRAYLKLWEYFTVSGNWPKRGDKCIDLGSSPGGWTWVLSELDCSVISVDKAPLADLLQAHPKIQKLKKDAFTLKPEEIGKVDWLFSDIICYPNKLLELIHLWLASGLAKNLVCTIKFQADTDFKAMQGFQAIPGSKTQHLSCNKHELTWSLIRT